MAGLESQRMSRLNHRNDIRHQLKPKNLADSKSERHASADNRTAWKGDAHQLAQAGEHSTD